MLATPTPKSVRESKEVLLVDRAQHGDDRLLHDLVLQRGDAQRALPAIPLRDVHPTGRLGTISTGVYLPMQHVHPLGKDSLILSPRHSVHSRRRVVLESVITLHQ